MVVLLLVSHLMTLGWAGGSGPDEWRRHASPVAEALHKVFFVDDDLGWAVTYGTGTVIHTSDGGETWTVQATLDADYIERIQFLDRKVGFVCGDYGYVFKTADGGATWQEISPLVDQRIQEKYRNDPSIEPPDGQFVAYYDMEFFDEDNGFVWGIAFNPTDRRNTFGYVLFETHDGGASWEQLSNDAMRGYREQLMFSERLSYDKRTVFGVHYSDRKRAWQAARHEGKSIVRRTVDGGQTWSDQPLPDLGDWMLRNIAFLDENRGFVVGGERLRVDGKVTFGRGVILYTENGGETWAPSDLMLPALHDIVLSPTYVWVVGQEGAILSRPRY